MRQIAYRIHIQTQSAHQIAYRIHIETHVETHDPRNATNSAPNARRVHCNEQMRISHETSMKNCFSVMSSQKCSKTPQLKSVECLTQSLNFSTAQTRFHHKTMQIATDILEKVHAFKQYVFLRILRSSAPRGSARSDLSCFYAFSRCPPGIHFKRYFTQIV